VAQPRLLKKGGTQRFKCRNKFAGVAELSPAERAKSTARRETIYEELHPETRHGGDRRSDQVANFATCSGRFTSETATVTGRAERSVMLGAASNYTASRFTKFRSVR
jgi:hypothetical protein